MSKKKKVRSRRKRVVAISDLHCGHYHGLTPPRWQTTTLQRRFWEWYRNKAEEFGGIDALIVNGDAIEGKAKKAEGLELITADRNTQIEMARQCIEAWKTKNIFVVAGTAYHTGRGEDWEQQLAEKVKGTFHDVLTLEVNGLIIEARHQVGRSVIPHGRATAPLRELMWNALGALFKRNVQADVILRSHVHYRFNIECEMGRVVLSPALQINSRFGKRVCSGMVDVGFVWFDIWSKEDYTCQSKILRLGFEQELSSI